MNRLTELRFDGQRIWREIDEREEKGLTVERDDRDRFLTDVSFKTSIWNRWAKKKLVKSSGFCVFEFEEQEKAKK